MSILLIFYVMDILMLLEHFPFLNVLLLYPSTGFTGSKLGTDMKTSVVATFVVLKFHITSCT